MIYPLFILKIMALKHYLRVNFLKYLFFGNKPSSYKYLLMSEAFEDCEYRKIG